MARGQMLLFLHADSALPPGYGALLVDACQAYTARNGQPPKWGCFETIQIDVRPILYGDLDTQQNHVRIRARQ